MTATTIHDFVGIGVGPFNLGLACLTDPVDELDGVFLEARDELSWHPGMMLDDATLQVPFLADLVTMADPTSRWSFLSYLKETGSLYPFYIRESFFPLRREYDDYCRWAAERLDTVRFGQSVASVEHDGASYVVSTSAGEQHRARRLVLGVGTRPRVPEALRGVLGGGFETGASAPSSTTDPTGASAPSSTTDPTGASAPSSTTEPTSASAPSSPTEPTTGVALHSSDYLRHKQELQRLGSITIVGSGQSAAEIYRDLLAESADHGYRLTWLTRSPRFFPMEYAKLTLEMTSPEYTSYFHDLPAATRDRLGREHRTLYKGISAELIDEIFDLHYRLRVQGDGPHTTLVTNTTVTGASHDGSAYELACRHDEAGEDFALRTEGLVLATGYATQVPSFLDPVRDRIRWDARGRFDVARGYTVDHDDREIFVQNAEEHTHGLAAPDLGMGAYRNSVIIAAMAGREIYPIEKRIAVQSFGVPR